MHPLAQTPFSLFSHLGAVIVEVEINNSGNIIILLVDVHFFNHLFSPPCIPTGKCGLTQAEFRNNDWLIRMSRDQSLDRFIHVVLSMPRSDVIIPHNDVTCTRRIKRRLQMNRITHIIDHSGRIQCLDVCFYFMDVAHC
ncbi:hypothetical protein D3C75_1044050 [compost metagenome]